MSKIIKPLKLERPINIIYYISLQLSLKKELISNILEIISQMFPFILFKTKINSFNKIKNKLLNP
jgi:hypothetical protein